MKPLIRLLVAVAILAAVVGVLYWPKKPAPAAPAAPPLVKVNQPDVHAITIVQPGQPPTVLTESGGTWKLTAPYAYPADPTSVTGLLSTLGGISGAENVGPSANAAAFGLDHPSTVTLALNNGGSLQFDFGGDSPTGGSSYMRVGSSGPIEMVQSYVKENAVKAPFLLQDKKLLDYSGDQLTALDVSSGGKHATFARVKDAWPAPQQSNIQTLLDALADGQMTAMPDPSGKSADADGINHPTATLKLSWPSGSATLTLGAKKGAAEYYARNSSGPAVFTLSDYLLTDITNLLSPPPTSTTPASAPPK